MLYPTVPVAENTCKGHLPNVLRFAEVTCKMETARIIACVTLLKQNWLNFVPNQSLFSVRINRPFPHPPIPIIIMTLKSTSL